MTREKAIAAAKANGGKLTREFSSVWCGVDKNKDRFPCEVIAGMVKDKIAKYSRFRPGSDKAGVEIELL